MLQGSLVGDYRHPVILSLCLEHEGTQNLGLEVDFLKFGRGYS